MKYPSVEKLIEAIEYFKENHLKDAGADDFLITHVLEYYPELRTLIANEKKLTQQIEELQKLTSKWDI